MTATLTEAPSRNRLGWYHTPYGRYLSVTTILDLGINKKGLQDWYAWEAAQCAIQNLPMLARVRGDKARRDAAIFLAGEAERIRDEAGDLGSAIHADINASILGIERPEPSEEQAPFMAAFRQFVADWQPEWEATELVVANPEDGWAGTADWWAWLNLPGVGRTLVAGDSKSGKPDKRRDKATYPAAAMQLSAYRRGTVGWLRDGTEVVPPKADHAVILHLRPDHYPDTGGYALVPVDTSDEVYQWFLSARAVALGERAMAAKVIGEPYALPTMDEGGK